MKQNILLTVAFLFMAVTAYAQTGNISGSIRDSKTTVSYTAIQVMGTNVGVISDSAGGYMLNEVPAGEQNITISVVGYQPINQKVTVIAGETTNADFTLKEDKFNLNEVVITGTRTSKRRTDSPVIVNLINSKQLDQVVATSLSEGIRFQPGLRVETDCQTCNYTQIRMNGLQGGYSQILINGRAIFSPLTGLYGLEQIPTNMIERIEVVRGGVSALYGSSAIGGTVNVITKVPVKNEYSLTNTFQSIDGKANDNIFSGNGTLVNEKQNAGATFFVSNRNRQAFDANGDNFSEAPKLKANSFGANFFYMPTKNQKLNVSLSSIYEYRFGGEMVDKPAYLAQQSEERMHNILMGSVDYQVNFNENKNSLIFYYGGQQTDRLHYTGITPDDEEEKQAFFAAPPYGTSDVTTHQGGVQFNSNFNRFLGGNTVLTVGAEYVNDVVLDQIKSYNYQVDQTTKNFGAFVQNDWNVTPKINFLSGFRLDKHNLVDHVIFSPRLSLLYKMRENTQFRFGWGTGFRAPQAFDTDLHIAFAGGGVSRISLGKDLTQERSNSLTVSFNYDKVTEHFIAGFTLEGFHTYLKNAFYLFPVGEDKFGQRLEKRNGKSATVQGVTLEARANFDYVFQLDAGFTVQTSLYDEPVATINDLEPLRQFLRTPNNYGYATFTYTPTKKWSASANFVYTGAMKIAHYGGEGTGQVEDEYFTSPNYTQADFRIGHTFEFERSKTGLEVFGGIKNVFNAYQTNFDTGKNRDSNYIYGPSLPRTFFVGLRIKTL